MDRVAVDVLGPLPVSAHGNRFVLVAIDYFTKWPEAYALPNQEAETIADALIGGVFSRFGMPSVLHSDQGRNFEAKVFSEMCQKLGIHKTRTTPLHPQSDGLVERFMRTLGAQLALTTARDQRDWDVQLPLVLLACRSAVQESTGCTPALLMLGRELRTPAELTYGRPPDCPAAPPGPEYARKLQDRMDAAYRFAREQAKSAGIRQKRGYDVHVHGTHFTAGDLVWVYGPKRVRGRCPKLDSDWVGPCYVVGRVSEVVYRVKLAPRGRTVVIHRDRMAPYRGSDYPSFGVRSPRIQSSPCPQQPSVTPLVTPAVPPRSQARFRGEVVTPLGAVVPPPRAGSDSSLVRDPVEASPRPPLASPSPLPTTSWGPGRPQRTRRRLAWYRDFILEDEDLSGRGAV